MSDGVVDEKVIEEMTIEEKEEAPEVEIAEGEEVAGSADARDCVEAAGISESLEVDEG